MLGNTHIVVIHRCLTAPKGSAAKNVYGRHYKMTPKIYTSIKFSNLNSIFLFNV